MLGSATKAARPIAPAPQPLVSAAKFAATICLAQLALMLFTYTTCVKQRECPALPHLPTISNTWENPPGNYASRYVVSFVCIGIGLVQVVLWGPERGKALACCGWKATTYQTLGTLGALFLSGVGAICDSDNDPQCEGQSTLHTGLAVAFFVLTNTNMVVLTKSTGRPWLAAALGAVSLLFKLRWAPLAALGLGGLADQTLLAVVEWSDVFLILGWTWWYVHAHRQGYSLQLLQGPPPPSAATHDRLSARTLCLTALGLFVGNLVTCLAIYCADGKLQPGSWPFISDLWTFKPNNWISRWSVVLGGFVSIGAHYLLYVIEGRAHPRWTGLAVVALLGLCLVGCVNEAEDFPLHCVGATIFFAGYDTYMVGRAAASLRGVSRANAPNRNARRVAFTLLGLALTSAFLSLVRFAPNLARLLVAALRLPPSHSLARLALVGTAAQPLGAPLAYAFALIEWADALSIIGFFCVAVLSQGEAAKTTSFLVGPDPQVPMSGGRRKRGGGRGRVEPLLASA